MIVKSWFKKQPRDFGEVQWNISSLKQDIGQILSQKGWMNPVKWQTIQFSDLRVREQAFYKLGNVLSKATKVCVPHVRNLKVFILGEFSLRELKTPQEPAISVLTKRCRVCLSPTGSLLLDIRSSIQREHWDECWRRLQKPLLPQLFGKNLVTILGRWIR